MKTKKYLVEIKGESPIVWNVYKDELIKEYKQLKKDQLEEWGLENWPRKAAYDEDGMLVFPWRWLHSALIKTCMTTRMIPHWESKKNATFTSYIKDLYIYDQKGHIKKDMLERLSLMLRSQPGNYKSNTKVLRHLPLLKEWKAKYKITDPHGKMTLKELRELLDYTGQFIGLGDLRYLKYGRFAIESLTII